MGNTLDRVHLVHGFELCERQQTVKVKVGFTLIQVDRKQQIDSSVSRLIVVF